MNGEMTSGSGGDDKYSLNEAFRQINALWKKQAEMLVETTNNGKELAQIQAQNNYIVKLLEKIDACNQLALPRCAERGVVLNDVTRQVGRHTDDIDDIKPRLEQLEGTARILKWVAAIISGVLIVLIGNLLRL